MEKIFFRMKISVNSATCCINNNIIFKNVDISLSNSEICIVMGPNGCGKTTFIKCLCKIQNLEYMFLFCIDNKKNVSFHKSVKVILIPTKGEYLKLRDKIWWSSSDINEFKKNYKNNIKVIMNLNNTNIYKAKKILDP